MAERLPDLARENGNLLTPQQMKQKFYECLAERKKQHIKGKNVDIGDLSSETVSDDADKNFSKDLSDNITVRTREDLATNEDLKYKVGTWPFGKKNGYIVCYKDEPIGMVREDDHLQLQKLLNELFILEVEAEDEAAKTKRDALAEAKLLRKQVLDGKMDQNQIEEGDKQVKLHEKGSSDYKTEAKGVKKAEIKEQKANDAYETLLHALNKKLHEDAEYMALTAANAQLKKDADDMNALVADYDAIMHKSGTETTDAERDRTQRDIYDRKNRMRKIMAKFLVDYMSLQTNKDKNKDYDGGTKKNYIEKDLCDLLRTHNLYGKGDNGAIRETVMGLRNFVREDKKYLKANPAEKQLLLEKKVAKYSSSNDLDTDLVQYMAQHITDGNYVVKTKSNMAGNANYQTGNFAKKGSGGGAAGGDDLYYEVGKDGEPVAPPLAKDLGYNQGSVVDRGVSRGVRVAADGKVERYTATDLVKQPWPVLGQLFTDNVVNSAHSESNEAKIIKSGILKKLLMGGASLGMQNTPNHIGITGSLEELGRYIPHEANEASDASGNKEAGKRVMMEIVGELFLSDASIQRKINLDVTNALVANRNNQLKQHDIVYNYAGLSDEVGLKEKTVINSTIKYIAEFYNQVLGVDELGLTKQGISPQEIARIFYTKDSPYSQAPWDNAEEVVGAIEFASKRIYEGDTPLLSWETAQGGAFKFVDRLEAEAVANGVDPKLAHSVNTGIKAATNIYQTYATLSSLFFAGKGVWNLGRRIFGFDKGTPWEKDGKKGVTYDYESNLKSAGANLLTASAIGFVKDPSKGFNAIPFIGGTIENLYNVAAGNADEKTLLQMMRDPTLIEAETRNEFFKNTIGPMSLQSLIDSGVLKQGKVVGGKSIVDVDAEKLLEMKNHPHLKALIADPKGRQIIQTMTKEIEKMISQAGIDREQLDAMSDKSLKFEDVIDMASARTAQLDTAMTSLGDLASGVDTAAILALPDAEFKEKMELYKLIAEQNEKLNPSALDAYKVGKTPRYPTESGAPQMDGAALTKLLAVTDNPSTGGATTAKDALKARLTLALQEPNISSAGTTDALTRYFTIIAKLANSYHVDKGANIPAWSVPPNELYDYWNAPGNKAVDAVSGSEMLDLQDYFADKQGGSVYKNLLNGVTAAAPDSDPEIDKTVSPYKVNPDPKDGNWDDFD